MDEKFGVYDMNEELLAVQECWARRLYKQVSDGYKANEREKGKLSCPFGFGVSKHYLDSRKKIMVVGQEANDHSLDCEKWNLENWRNWAVDYLDYQLYGEDYNGRNFEKNNSPFWRFLNKLKDKGYGVCWNNIDKVRRYIPTDGAKDKEDYLLERKDGDKNKDRSILHKKIFDAGSKSLLQKEIAISQPDLVVFAVGPKWPYYHSLSLAFFDANDGKGVDGYLNEGGVKYPQIEGGKYCVEISEYLNLKIPAYYTYHPNYLSMKKIMDDVVNIVTACKRLT